MVFSMTIPIDRRDFSSDVSTTEESSIVSLLNDKSEDELRTLLSDEEAYQKLLLSLEAVKIQNTVTDELRNETLQCARENLEQEPRITELTDQCRLIRSTDLASAQAKLHELERTKEDLLKYNSLSSLHRLQEAMNKTEEESETLHQQLLDGKLEFTAFVQKYKKLRYNYNKQSLVHLCYGDICNQLSTIDLS